MPEIVVLRSRMETGLEEWKNCREKMAGLKGRISAIRNGMRGKVRSKNKIGLQLVEICGQMDRLCRDVWQLEQVLETVMCFYVAAEQKLENSGRELSVSIWNENRFCGQEIAALSPVYSGQSNPLQRTEHGIVEEQGPVREEWKGWKWHEETTAFGMPAGAYLKGSLWGGEWEEEDVRTSGENHRFGWKGTQTGWLARGDAMGCLGESSFAGSAALLPWEESLEAGLTWEQEATEKWMAKLAVETELSLKGVEFHGEEENENYFSEISGSLGFASAKASLCAGIGGADNMELKQQVTLEAGVLKGEAKAGFELWGITCAVGLQGTAGAAGIHAGYELTEQSAQMNVGAALGVGSGIDVEIDWSDAELPQTRKEILERKKRRRRKKRGVK